MSTIFTDLSDIYNVFITYPVKRQYYKIYLMLKSHITEDSDSNDQGFIKVYRFNRDLRHDLIHYIRSNKENFRKMILNNNGMTIGNNIEKLFVILFNNGFILDRR